MRLSFVSSSILTPFCNPLFLAAGALAHSSSWRQLGHQVLQAKAYTSLDGPLDLASAWRCQRDSGAWIGKGKDVCQEIQPWLRPCPRSSCQDGHSFFPIIQSAIVRKVDLPLHIRSTALEQICEQEDHRHLPLLLSLATSRVPIEISLAEQACRGVLRQYLRTPKNPTWLWHLARIASHPLPLGQAAMIAASALAESQDHRALPYWLALALNDQVQRGVRNQVAKRLLDWCRHEQEQGLTTKIDYCLIQPKRCHPPPPDGVDGGAVGFHP